MPKDRMDPSQIQKDIQFSERLLEFHGWIKKAEDLLAAASLLESEIRQMWAETEIDSGSVVRTSGRANVQASHFMLNAYAMENYFKALLLYRNRESRQNRLIRRLPSYLKQHDLIKLAKEAKLSLSVPEEELLARLSRDSIWAARYPVPTEPNAIRAMQQFSNGRSYLIAYYGPKDIDRLQDFMSRLRSIVEGEIGATTW